MDPAEGLTVSLHQNVLDFHKNIHQPIKMEEDIGVHHELSYSQNHIHRIIKDLVILIGLSLIIHNIVSIGPKRTEKE